MLAAVMIVGAVVGVLPALAITSQAAASDTETEVTAGDIAKQYLYQTYLSAEDKVNLDPYMKQYLTNGKYTLYCNPYTGEVYVKDLRSGQFLTSNPYYIGDAYATQTIPAELMSQFQLTFTQKDGTEVIYGSYDWSASRGQILPVVSANTLRLDYTVGDTTTRYLVPNGITRQDFWSDIIIPAQTILLQTIREMVQSLRGEVLRLRDGVGEEDETWTDKDRALNYVYENDEVLASYCVWAASQGGAYSTYQGHKIPGWQFEDVLAYFWNFEPEERVAAGEDIISTFDAWYRVCYVYYKALCGKEGKNYLQYSKMGNATTDYFSLCTNYALKDPNDPKLREAQLRNMQTTYPATAERDKTDDTLFQAIYVLSEGLTNANKRKLQKTINKYAPNYSMDMMYEDEEETQLEPDVEINPVFRLSLEYTLTDKGVQVSLPANSIYYDETLYTIVSIDLLPYMGSGDMNDGGYTFYPDGSGTIIDYDDFAKKNITLSGTIYGQDYTFHAASGANQQPIRMPVYGAVTNEDIYYFEDIYTGRNFYVNADTYAAGTFTYEIRQRKVDEKIYDEVTESTVTRTHYEFYYFSDGNVAIDLPYETTGANAGKQYYYASIEAAEANSRTYLNSAKELPADVPAVTVSGIVAERRANGYLAIVEDGASMCTMNLTINGLSNNPYASSFVSFMPLPQDTYDLSEANASADSVMFTVKCSEKYLGRLTLQYVMLTDKTKAETVGTDYVASYVGMANAYRDYLSVGASAILSLMDSDDLQSQLPLYIETFGVMETIKRFLTIPFEVKVPLTTFEDVQTMYGELTECGITNVKFKLTGYANGGMTDATYPSRLKWEGKAGGKSGFRKLVQYVKANAETGLQIYPEFDFQYIQHDRLFDGIRWKKVAARTVDNRYAFKSIYNSYLQEYDGYREGIIVAPNLITGLYEKFNRRYLKYDNDAISLGSIAGDLSSSYDTDAMTLREDAITYTLQTLAKVAENYQIMSSGGNVYALKYVDHLLSAPIDSSHFRASSYTIPFFGMVMHGTFSYAGGPLNEEGNPDYQILRSVESGACLYFLLSYRNTQYMKEYFDLSQHYSVNYQIWKEDVVSYYNTLNDAIGDLQGHLIVDHQLISGERVVEETETVAARKSLEDEYLAVLKAQIDAAVNSKKRDLQVLRAFYLESLGLIAESIVSDEVMQGQVENVPSKREERKAELIAEMQDYDTYLRYLYDNEDAVLSYVIREVQPNLADQDILHAIDPSGNSVFTSAFVDAVCEKRISLETSQVIGISFDTEALLAQALHLVGLDEDGHSAADVCDPDNAAYDKDFAAFAQALRTYCTEQAQAPSSLHTQDAYKLCIHMEELTYQSAYRYVTDSVSINAAFEANKAYDATIYTIDDGSIVLVTYAKGADKVHFLINYNMFSVRVNIEGMDEITLTSQSFLRIDP